MYNDIHVERARSILDDILVTAQQATAALADKTARILLELPLCHTVGVRLAREQRGALQKHIHDVLRNNAWCNGAGFASYAVSKTVGEEGGYWTLEWWRQEGDTIQYAPLEHNQEQRRRLDFRLFEWFRQPANCHLPVIDGPYVDYVCNGAYTITIAHPVLIGEKFAGVAAVDMLVSTLDRLLLPALGAIGKPALIINDDARVVTSTVPGVRSGSLLKSQGVNRSADGEVPSLRLVILPSSHTESHRAFVC
ncbi:cache domain-containing protein [Xenorhabdus bovienii]|uniref:cache domain-containing protein n=1 Tax=Xenorhabdus bovienii TaxID=40576 RepID=UPI0023B34F5C|nr:cache domain-containing protein [Xenorhabdus bovienii]MDE9493829.1 cache domain-containing protein [Xenorhabdus bovienii]MDE9502366.1 cache domain-containing protein [Xenorhabdus bovienii]MDE9519416.1 cache domain-containing protein [Xenorhabdus bovienii]MDE9526155.1 cache domain-containing protein [Xenorhabdus bovienii]MDE9569090.1 cache domain-containing protein [Xenorhabdus bovienii]